MRQRNSAAKAASVLERHLRTPFLFAWATPLQQKYWSWDGRFTLRKGKRINTLCASQSVRLMHNEGKSH